MDVGVAVWRVVVVMNTHVVMLEEAKEQEQEQGKDGSWLKAPELEVELMEAEVEAEAAKLYMLLVAEMLNQQTHTMWSILLM